MAKPKQCIVILSGTKEIDRPLYQVLVSSLEDRVYLIQAKNLKLIAEELNLLLEKHIVWVFPSNELVLNNLYKIINNKQINNLENLKIPGSATVNRTYNSQELSNKFILFSLLKEHDFTNLNKAKTLIVKINKYFNKTKYLQTIKWPVIIKPAIKDEEDSFTNFFPSKLIISKTKDEFLKAMEFIEKSYLNRKFMIQEIIEGINVSWCGYICAGESFGYQVTSLVKSPYTSYGGTTTLAKLDECEPQLQKSVDEIAKILNLDGIFEIEFIYTEQGLYFFYEINPRPWLQVSLLLHQEKNIFLEYLSKHNLTIKINKIETKIKKYWGSAFRYLSLNEKNNTQIFLNVLLIILKYDIIYSLHFKIIVQIKYTLKLLEIIIKISLKRNVYLFKK